MIQYVTSRIDPSTRNEERDILRASLMEVIYKREVDLQSEDSINLSVPEELVEKARKAILSSLLYDTMKDREVSIVEAYDKTCHWIFEGTNEVDKWLNFKCWLQSDEKLYWITGKAGSGKSTLMKYICYPFPVSSTSREMPRCHQYLMSWSGDNQLIVATFYFWNSGAQMQMHQRGLFLSLLHQIFEQCPKLIRLSCQERWESLCLFGKDSKDWTDKELQHTLLQAVQALPDVSSKIAFFVDGLDEFNGDHTELICLFQDLISCRNVKLTAASRPWVDFEDAFTKRPSLMLEHFTYADIKHYVTSKFETEPIFVQLSGREESFATELIEKVVTKASGVFLWVTLVVASLISGMNYGDRVLDLQKRLDHLPSELAELYEKMVTSLDPFYLEHAAQLFSLVDASKEPMNLILAFFADEVNPQFALSRQDRILTNGDMVVRMDTMRRRINSRCKGLLEVCGPRSTTAGLGLDDHRHQEYTVQYLHRTVKDYVESERVRKIFRDAMKSEFDPHLQLLAGHLAYLKLVSPGSLPVAEEGRALEYDDTISELVHDIWANHFMMCFEYARLVQADMVPHMVALLDELDKIGLFIFKALSATIVNPIAMAYAATDCWTLSPNPFDFATISDRNDKFGRTFLSLMVTAGIDKYVKAKTSHGCLVQKVNIDFNSSDMVVSHTIWPLLMDAVYIDSAPNTTMIPRTESMRCRLLVNGEDPNCVIGMNYYMSRTTGPLLMKAIYMGSALNTTTISRTESMCRHLLLNGADPNYVIRGEYHRSPWTDVVTLRIKSAGVFYRVLTSIFLSHGAKTDIETIDLVVKQLLAQCYLSWPQFGIWDISRNRRWYQQRNLLASYCRDVQADDNSVHRVVSNIISMAVARQPHGGSSPGIDQVR